MRAIRSVLMTSLIFCSLMAVLPSSWAQDVTEPESPESPESKEQLDPDFYVVPKDNNLDAVLGFIEKIMTYEPTDAETYFAHRRNASTAILAAAHRVLELEKDKTSEAYRIATGTILADRVRSISRMNKKEQQTAFEEIKQHFLGKRLDPSDHQIIMAVATGLENSQNTRLAIDAYQFFGERAAKSGNEEMTAFGAMLTGAARRLGLLGKEMSLHGTTFDGKPFDLESLRGKVILVDFWATWCGPCLAAYPNVLRLHEKYHDKGFEVVGVSLDQDRDTLANFLEAKQVPWTTLHEKDGKQPPAVTEYGIMGIPTMFLLDQNFRVVSLQARGPELAVLLEKLLGKPDEKDAKVDDAD